MKTSQKFVLQGRFDVVIIVSDNGLAPTRRKAIIWINDGLVYRQMYASRSLTGSVVGAHYIARFMHIACTLLTFACNCKTPSYHKYT